MFRRSVFAVLAIAVTVVMAALVANHKTALGLPSYQADCSACHGVFGSYPNVVTAAPSSASVAPGASYSVNITMSVPVNGSSGTGYWIANSSAAGNTGTSAGVFVGGKNQGASGTWIANMTAPATPGLYYYRVFGESGPVGANGFVGVALYSITVANPTMATPTNTAVLPTATNTAVLPTATNTTVPPTATGTIVPPTATSTTVPPTATGTRVPPTP
ncbi:MAG: hypothetical protein Q7O66_02900 [Dehalococcoidia bacterium]|nr:hypothetical protein [Dehalococcoidia bacterium]